MGVFRRIVTAGRTATGFLLGPAREIAATPPGTRLRNAAVAQAAGDAAAPWWVAELRKLWVWALGFVLVWVHQASGWDFTGLSDQIDGAVWGPFIGWLLYRVANRRG